MPTKVWTYSLLASLVLSCNSSNAIFAKEIQVQDKLHSYEAVGDFGSTLPKNPISTSSPATKSKGIPEEAIIGIMKIAREKMNQGNYELAIKLLSGTYAPNHKGLKMLLCDAHKEFGDYLLAKGNTEKAIQEFKAALDVSNSMWRTDSIPEVKHQ